MTTEAEPSTDWGEIRTLVFDVLGTVVDEAGSIRAELSVVLADAGREPADTVALASEWADRLEAMIADVVAGRVAWRSNDALRRAALDGALASGGITELPAGVVDALAGVGHRLAPWPDSVQALTTLSQSYALVALSNASLAQLFEMFAAADLRWHGIASGELVRAYKPDRAVYAWALEHFGLNPAETAMVAAHPWDLRAAAGHGLRTVYVSRAGEGELGPEDRFDLGADDLAHLARLLTGTPTREVR